MKLFLDDERPCPEGWTLAKTAQEAIDLLATGTVTEASLDHDLGDESVVGTGYAVLCWLEEAVATRGFDPPRVVVHSANAAGRERMVRAVESIERFVEARRESRGE